VSIKKENKEEFFVQQLLSRNTRSFEELYDQFSPALYGIISKIVKNEKLAEDILQETFLKIWNNSASYDKTKSRLFTWMLNIARNAAIDYMRSKQGKIDKKNKSVDLLGMNEPHAAVESNHEHIGLKKIVNSLKNEQHEIIRLTFFEGYSQTEIAEKLQIPLGTVKTRCRSALHHLRKTLEETG